MDAAVAAVENSFIVSILVAVWLCLLIALAICTKVVQIRKCVQELRQEKLKKRGEQTPDHRR